MNAHPLPAAPLSSAARGLSLAEFLIGAFIVIGHNVFHIVPNEVPILFVLGIVSIRLREGSFAALGLTRPKSWLATIGIAAATAAIVIVLGEYVTEPLAAHLGLHETGGAAKALGTAKGDYKTSAQGLLLVWTFAAFGECVPNPDNRMELDPTKVDAWGIPAMRISAKWRARLIACCRKRW